VDKFIFWRRKRDSNPRAPFDANGFKEYIAPFRRFPCCCLSFRLSISYGQSVVYRVLTTDAPIRPADLHGICTDSSPLPSRCYREGPRFPLIKDCLRTGICSHGSSSSDYHLCGDPGNAVLATRLRGARHLFNALADVFSSGDCLFFRASRTLPRRKRIALRVFGSPNFPNAAGRTLLQKIGSPEKVASNPISLALVVPRCAPLPARKAVRRAFQPSAGGQLLKRDKPKAA
jgi:hypothetical protein